MSALLLVGVIVFVEPVFAQGGVFGSWSISALVRLSLQRLHSTSLNTFSLQFVFLVLSPFP